MKFPKSYFAISPYMSLGSIIVWFILIGANCVWEPYYEINRGGVVLLYSSLMICISIAGIASTIYFSKKSDRVFSPRVFLLEGILLMAGTILALVFRVHYTSPMLPYLSAALCAVGGTGIVSDFFLIKGRRNFNSTLTLFCIATLVAVVIYLIANSCSVMVASILLATLPGIATFFVYLQNIDTASFDNKDEMHLVRSSTTASIEIFFLLLILSFRRANFFLLGTTEALNRRTTETVLIVFLVIVLFIAYIDFRPERPVRINIIKNALLGLLAFVAILRVIETFVNSVFPFEILITFSVCTIYLLLIVAIFTYQISVVTIRERTKALISIFLTVGIVGLINTPVFNQDFRVMLESVNAETSLLLPALLSVSVVGVLLVRYFASDDELVIKLPGSELGSPSPETMWLASCQNVSKEYKLTNREGEVLQLLAQGFAAKNISERLDISVYTVRTYIQRMYGKIEINSKEELMNVLDKHRR